MAFGPVLGGQQHAAAEIFHEGNTFLAGERGQFAAVGRGDKTVHEKITAMHLEQQAGVRAGGFGVIL